MRTKTHNSRSSNIQSGYRYAYLDAATNYRFIHSEYSIDDNRGALGKTLNQIYKNQKSRRNSEDLAHVFYNDETPEGKRLMIIRGDITDNLRFLNEILYSRGQMP